MGLLEDLERAKPTVNGEPCTVQRVLEAFPEQADGIWEAVMEGPLSGGAISRLFGAYGFSSSADTVNRHRRGECACHLRMPERYES